jgi:hypothetical protein
MDKLGCIEQTVLAHRLRLFYESGILLNQANTKSQILLLDIKLTELIGTPLAEFQCTECAREEFAVIFERAGQSLSTSYQSSSQVAAGAIDDTRTRVLLLCRAAQSLFEYRKSLVSDSRMNSDSYIYNTCSAFIEAKMSEANIHQWFEAEGIPLIVYAKHLVDLRPDGTQ